MTFDDQKDPKRAIAGMEKMAQEGIHYVVGPNVDDGAAAQEQRLLALVGQRPAVEVSPRFEDAQHAVEVPGDLDVIRRQNFIVEQPPSAGRTPRGRK